MNFNVSQISERCRLAVELSDSLCQCAGITSSKLSELSSKLQNLALQVNSLEQSGESSQEEIDQKRKLVTELRTEAVQCSKTTDELMEHIAEAYRSKVVGDKDAFEACEPAVQAQAQPEAFEAKQAFHTCKQLKDVITHISSDLLDVNGELDHAHLEQLPNRDVGDYEYEDNVPSRSSLSQ